MLALAGIDALAAVGFAVIYAAAGSQRLTQGAFAASLIVFFVAMAAVWVRIERSRPGGRDALSRLGRGGLALLLVVVGLPTVVLTPLFALPDAVHADAGLGDLIRSAMVLLLIALLLTIALNVAGLAVAAVSALRSSLISRGRG
jgi:hypothetical protein